MAYKDLQKQKEAQHRSYLKNKEQYLDRSRADKAKRREYLSKVKDTPCIDCGIKYPFYVMDLDHRDADEKRENLAKMIVRYGWKTVLEEIDKCDVVCSNCHRARTYERKQRFVNNGVLAQFG